MYFAGGFDKLHILDISTPTSPVVVADYAEPAEVEDVAVEGDSVFVLTFDFVEPAVREMDFTVPAAPVTKRAFVHQHVLQHIRVSRRRVFGLDGNEVVAVQF